MDIRNRQHSVYVTSPSCEVVIFHKHHFRILFILYVLMVVLDTLSIAASNVSTHSNIVPSLIICEQFRDSSLFVNLEDV